jgi:hypothetical protein
MPVTCELQIPNLEHLFSQIHSNAGSCGPHDVITEKEGVGKTVTIVGAGPSLRDHHADILPAHDVWACNSALPYLVDHGLPVTHGFTVDQGQEMMGPREWERTFDVTYLLASTVHPDVTRHLKSQGRTVRWFHNYCGLKDPDGWVPPEGFNPEPEYRNYEFYLYCTLFPPAPQVGYGLNSVPRAVCLAVWMGFKHIRVIGADCAATPNGPWMPPFDTPTRNDWLRQCCLYADGRSALEAYGSDVVMVQKDMETRLGDPSSMTRWHTRPDMVISAIHMANLAKAYAAPRPGQPSVIELVGNTLPNAMLDKPQEWFDAFPQLNLDSGVTGFEPAYEAA